MAAGRQLNRVEMFEAAQWLGDRPQTVLPYHGLVTGRCEAWIAGELPEPRALLVRAHYVPTEPFGFGRDAASLIKMLLEAGGWTCINVGDGLMESAAAEFVAQSGKNVKRFGDLYNVLVQPSETFSDPIVRFLTREDEEILSNAPRPVSPGNPKLTPLILSEGLCAAAVMDGQIASRAFAYAVTPTHADIAVATSENFTGRGLVTACSSLLIERLRQLKLTVVWSTGETNLASQHIAKKLGFVATSPRVYLSLA
jgi:hypothetical protein